jgi:adenylyltransferase/sulfurtransferase
LDRYSRQIRFAPLGEAGQRRLLESRAAVVGCGALGTVIVGTLARAGVGFLRIIDRDLVETTNLQRQILFDENDARLGLPKAQAACEKIREINSHVSVEPVVADLHAHNIDRYLGDVDVILDGTDNFETRFLINDFAHREKKPWVYGGAVGSTGQSMTIFPGQTPCLGCLIESVPPAGTMPTCETAGILSPASMIVASIQSAEAIKILSGNVDAVTPGLFVLDVWTGRVRRIGLDGLRERADCPACRGEYRWLDGSAGSFTTSLCGRDAVQVAPPGEASLDWNALIARLAIDHSLDIGPFLLRFAADGYELSVFKDGRAIIRGTSDPALARSVYARYIGG